FASLIGDERLSDVGELGIAFQTEVKRSCAPYLYYHNNVMGGGLWSSGQLRSAGIANSVGARWRFLLEDNQWQPLCGSDVLRKRLERIALLLSKCYLSAAFRKLDYDSNFWPFLLAACAGWFYRMAINLRSLTNASSTQFDEHGGIYFNAIRLEGCGKLVKLVESKSIKTKMSNDRTTNWVVEARTFLAVRNHSRLAHGVDDLDQTGYADLLKCSKGLIFELLEPELYQEFSETYAELVLPPFHTQFKSGMGKLLSDYLD
nr:hypothetical protein [Tanacetum cinerariifolium]